MSAALSLVVVCSPVLGGVRERAYGDSAAQTARGLANVVDGLSPGLTAEFSFHSPLPGGHILLLGASVLVAWGDVASAAETRWSLPDVVLIPEHHYLFSMSADRVEVLDSV
jgi:hypothetical protein